MSKRIFAALLACLALMQFAAAYVRIETARDASLSVNYAHPNVTFRIYRVADVSETVRFTLCGDFARYTDLQALLDDAAWDELAMILDARVIRDGFAPAASGRTDANGVLAFHGLRPGLYLVMGDTYRIGNTTYYPQTALVSLPGLRADDTWDYAPVMTPKFSSERDPEIPKTGISVQKIWVDAGAENERPVEITVQLMKDNTVVETVTLNAANNWRWSWTGLPVGYQYRVVETNVTYGYSDSYSREGDTAVIVNEYTFDIPDEKPPLDKPKLPQTGQLWWPVPLLMAAGLALVLIGLIRRRGVSHEEE